MSAAEPLNRPLRVLLVCTGNICRSALAERLGRAYLDEALGPNAWMVELHSAGIQAVSGSAMHPDSALVLQGLGGHPDGFVARQFEPDMAADADLVLALTRQHRRAILERAPKALSRTFTLREAADLLARLGDQPPPGKGLQERARALIGQLAGTRSGRHGSRNDDIPDPIGQPVEVHQEVGELIAAALLPLLRWIAGAPNEASPTISVA